MTEERRWSEVWTLRAFPREHGSSGTYWKLVACGPDDPVSGAEVDVIALAEAEAALSRVEGERDAVVQRLDDYEGAMMYERVVGDIFTELNARAQSAERQLAEVREEARRLREYGYKLKPSDLLRLSALLESNNPVSSGEAA